MKILAENNLDKDVLLDLIKRKGALIEDDQKLEKPSKIPGYVQNIIAADPFVVTLYSGSRSKLGRALSRGCCKRTILQYCI
jgi:hypothetical protein